MNGYLSREEVLALGFASVGEDVQISNKACFYGAHRMRIGNHVRIDDFCIFIGQITLGNYVHIANYTAIHSHTGSFVMGNFSTLSSRVAIYTASDDYSGEYMTNSVVPADYTNAVPTDIIVGDHVVVGTGSTLLPGALLPDGVAVGAMSLVKTPLDAWGIYAGIPCRRISERARDCARIAQVLGE